jgi:mRNA interferase MazF
MGYRRGDVVLVLFPDSGIHSDSVVMTDNLATILDNEIDRVIGNIPDTQQLDTALKYTLGL